MDAGSTYIKNSDRRIAPRIDYKGPVDIVFDGKLYKGVTVNISETGILIKSIPLDDFNIFDKLIITFQGPDLEPVKQIGRVARKTDHGLGILYLDENSTNADWQRPQIEVFFTP